MTTEKSFIWQAREQAQLTQEEAAGELGVSRPTYMNLEKNPGQLTMEQLEKLAAIFDVDSKDFRLGKVTPNALLELEQTTTVAETTEERISIPEENIAKFKQVLLYILEKIGAKPNIGQTALYKILYFIDFDYYEIYEKQLMGLRYLKNHYGPTPRAFGAVVKQMIDGGELVELKKQYFDLPQTKYLPKKSADLSILSAVEIKHIDEELERLGDKNAVELSVLSHEDVPWQALEEGEELDYEAVFYRTVATTRREYDADD